MIIRQETKDDFIAVYDLNVAAFEQEEEAKLVEQLRNDSHFIPELSIVAEEAGEIVGHILFTKVAIKGNEEHMSLALAPMAVAPNLQKSGIGTKLIMAGLERAKEFGYSSVIVLGHKDYYPKFGFERASKWGITCPMEVPDEVFLAMELEPGALEGKSGVVQYAAPFGI